MITTTPIPTSQGTTDYALKSLGGYKVQLYQKRITEQEHPVPSSPPIKSVDKSQVNYYKFIPTKTDSYFTIWRRIVKHATAKNMVFRLRVKGIKHEGTDQLAIKETYDSIYSSRRFKKFCYKWITNHKRCKTLTDASFYYSKGTEGRRSYMGVSMGDDEGAYCFEPSTVVRSNNQIKRIQKRRNDLILKDLEQESDDDERSADW